jgi:ABC-type molybdenum transport system ATPase subunit/photorepair protein PhrA
VALAALLGRLYGPVTALSNVQADVMTALVGIDRVSFRYPAASEVSLASLESIALPAPERAARGQDVLHDVSFTAPAGRLTALVGPPGAGKTTITATAHHRRHHPRRSGLAAGLRFGGGHRRAPAPLFSAGATPCVAAVPGAH